MIVLVMEGTWARDPWGLLGDVVQRLIVPAKRVEYPEQFGDAFSYTESIYIGERALKKKIEKLDRQFVLVGYSQGAQIVGDVAASMSGDSRLLRVYLIADPKRSPTDEVVGTNPGGMGVFGSRPVGTKARHFVAVHDFISSNNNPFISNVARYTLEKKKKGHKEWLMSFGRAAQERIPGGSLRKAITQVKDYLRTQAHTSYDSLIVENGLTATQWIAEDINKLAKELGYA